MNSSAVLSAITYDSNKNIGSYTKENTNKTKLKNSKSVSAVLLSLNDSPYAEPLTTHKTLSVADKSSIILKDFFSGAKRRSALILRLKEAATEPNNSTGILKRYLLEIRQLTLRLIEDALEVDYRSQVVDEMKNTAKSTTKLSSTAPIVTYKDIEIKDQIYKLAEIVTDVDHLFKVDNIRAMLPKDFPYYRNPFMLGKTVDQLADILPPHAEPGDKEVELKILELLRFKRAARVLLRAEMEVQNRLPVALSSLDSLLFKMEDDSNIEKLVRCVCVLIENNESTIVVDKEANFRALTNSPFRLEAHVLLRNLNTYRGDYPMRMDVQSAVRLTLQKVELDYLSDDPAVVFFMEWINSVLRQSLAKSLKPSDDTISVPSMQQTVKFKDYGITTKPLTMRNLTDHKYGDLTSEVSSRNMDTHEGYYVEKPPKLRNSSRNGSPSRQQSALTPNSKRNISFVEDGELSRNTTANKSIMKKKEVLAQSTLDLSASINAMSSTQIMSNTLVDESEVKAAAPIQPFVDIDLKKEIERVISEMGLLSKKKGTKGGNEKSKPSALMNEVAAGDKVDDDDAVQPLGPSEIASSLTALRYQLFKMQQELLRRQVLDTKHYKASGFDSLSHVKKGLTVIDSDPTNGNFQSMSNNNNSNSNSPNEKKTSSFYGQNELNLQEEEIKPKNGCKRLIEFNFDTINEKLLGRILKIRASPATDDDLGGMDNPFFVKKRKGKPAKDNIECTAYMVISKLMFNLLTEHSMETLLESKGESRKKMLRSIHEQLEKKADEEPEPKGELIPKVDRLLYKNVYVEDGVQVEISVTRNKECNGIEVQCTPLAGVSIENISTGPVTIVISDRELQVLLINQYGLFMQSKYKWNSMLMISQWIASRIRIHRVLTTQTSMLGDTYGYSTGISDGFSAFNRLSSSKTPNLTMNSEDFASMDNSFNFENDMTSRKSTANRNPLNTIMPQHEGLNKRNLVLLDVQLDRKIEISEDVRSQWQNRNVPSIAGIVVLLNAWQDLEMLVLEVKIRLPTAAQHTILKEKASRKLKGDDKNKGTRASIANNRRSRRRSIAAEEENKDDENASSSDSDDMEAEARGSVELEFQYTLTSSELSVFGSNELIMQKKVGLQNSGDMQGHPESFLWNILNRFQILFKGSLKNPFSDECNANESFNWECAYDRKILREVKTISSCVLVASVSVIGQEMLFQAEPVEKGTNKKIIPKTVTEEELTEIVLSEGLSPQLLDYQRRKELAVVMLNKLKLIEGSGDGADTGFVVDGPVFRLELFTFYETKLLKIACQKKPNHPAIDIGMVEINYQLTLSDLRILIKFEIDSEEVPSQFRFLYKGVPCSIKQEAFRRAWECLPRCIIASKQVEKTEISMETEDIEERRTKSVVNKQAGKISRLMKGQRRVSGKFSPIPLPTLCRVTENSDEVYLLHDGTELLVAGDIIRIGNVLSRDYIVAPMSRSEQSRNPKTVKIEPAYDLLEEPDFNLPTTGNFIYPKGVVGVITVNYKKRNLLPPPNDLGFKYDLPDETNGAETLASSSKLLTSKGLTLQPDKVMADSLSLQSAKNMNNGFSDNLKTLLNKSKKNMPANQVYTHCWIWKCVPQHEDTRPKWRQLYDDGLIPYDYEFKAATEHFKYFRVKAFYSYLEVLCTDARCSTLSLYSQRVDEMQRYPIEYFTKLAFDKVTSWNPEYKRGMEKIKFLKLMKDVNAFPDMKRPARTQQLEAFYIREVKENGIVNKFITYEGFVRLLQEIALIRYPVGKKGGGDGDDLPDDISTASSAVPESLASKDGGSLTSSNFNSNSKVSHKGGGKKDGGGGDISVGEGNKNVSLDPLYAAQVFEKFVLDIIMMYPDWYSIPWKEAKIVAMRKEALPYCAATRIAAMVRGRRQRRKYTFFIHFIIVFQATVRQRQSNKRTQSYIRILMEDWIFRQRYHAATRAQCLVRRYLKRCWYWRIMEKIKAQEVLVQKARRFRVKKIRQAQKKFILYKEAVRVNGVFCLIKMLKLDTRHYSRDNGVMLEVYTPYDQKKYQFPIEEVDLRKYMQLALEVDVLSVGDLIDIRNLKKVVSTRIIAYKAASKFASQNVVFSKHALGQRGEQRFTRGKKISGELFVCKVFETGDDVTIQLYHRYSCKVFNCSVSNLEVRSWVMDDNLTAAASANAVAIAKGLSAAERGQIELEAQKEPLILRPENKRTLQEWLLDQLVVDTRNGQFKVVFRRQLQKSRKLEMIIKIQSIFRKALTRRIVIEKLDALMLKVRVSPTDPTIYYLNKKTGASSWEKPKLLGVYDIPTEPYRQWTEVTYLFDGVLYRHYVNPHTGKYTTYTPDQAASKIQSLSRNFLLRPIRMPMAQFVKAGTIYKTAKAMYEKNKKKLAAVINYAIVSHVVDLDEKLAKTLYGEAVDLSEANPLVTRAYAFYMIGTCEAPIALNRERASTLFKDAARKDETNSRFDIAYYIYRFACLRNPYDHRTLLNLAVVQCMLYNENYNAEKLLRRALAISPFDDRVIEIWKFLKERFPDRQLLYNPMSRVNLVKMDKNGKKRVVHGRPVSEHNSWAGWLFVDDDEFGVSKKFRRHASYWYNPADGAEQQDPPDFKQQWVIRKQRSLYQDQADGLQQFYDPLTSEYFQYHELTDTYS